MHRSRSLPHLLLATVVLVWGGSFAAIKALVDHGLHAPDIAVGRYLIAAPGFGIALAAAGGMPGLTRRDAVRVIVAGLFVVAVYHLALNAGERTTTAGTASVVIAAAPAMALAMSLGLGLESFSRRRAAGLTVAFAGVVVVIVLGSGEHVSLDSVRGPLLVLLAASSFAAYNVLVKPLLGRFDPVAVSAATSLVGTAALLPFGLSGTASRLGDVDAGDLALIAYLGLVCTLAGYVPWTIGLRRLDPSRAVAYLYGVPVVAVAVGAITLGESVTGWLALGGLLVVGGVALSQ
ncbi:MAG TPA: DMT family transporter [Gaiellales bacterium]|nr:DMT family transporter [Gaiellales bacterium]